MSEKCENCGKNTLYGTCEWCIQQKLLSTKGKGAEIIHFEASRRRDNGLSGTTLQDASLKVPIRPPRPLQEILDDMVLGIERISSVALKKAMSKIAARFEKRLEEEK